MAPASAIPRASGYKIASKVVVTKTEPAAHKASMQNDDDYVYIRVPREKVVPVDSGLTEMVQHRYPRALGHRKQRQFFTPFRCSCRHPRRSSRMVIPAPFHTRVFRSYRWVEVVIRAWIRWRPHRTWRP